MLKRIFVLLKTYFVEGVSNFSLKRILLYYLFFLRTGRKFTLNFSFISKSINNILRLVCIKYLDSVNNRY